ncbi:conserved hypothetical protein [Mycoplasmoides pneumoniae FH]|uniref:ECF transporter S component n=1 Tax=Mycoplasmoides pneumoniae (strain ATCC 15531 / DSM 23978 / CIP 103766 / NBRC 14401 / NCTC 10119 / FH) TaxID=722438 RepID=A0A0H3DM36_MYCPB|nr:conserved hypothetical protein [Mycoplasmoides pneumoniae FH]
MLMALSFIFNIFSINVTSVLKVSFTRIPFALIGWMFGPVWGFTFGAIADTMDWLTRGYTWFWLFAIQKPMFCFLAGLVKGVYQVRQSSTNWKIDFWILQSILIGFFVLTLVLLLMYLTDGNFQAAGNQSFGRGFDVNVHILQGITMAAFISFFVGLEIFLGWKYTKVKKPKEMILNLYILMMALLMTLVVSLLIGTIASIEYLVFLSGKPSKNFVKYGSYFFLMPRVLVQALLMPLYLALFKPLIRIAENNLRNYLRVYNLSWKR